MIYPGMLRRQSGIGVTVMRGSSDDLESAVRRRLAAPRQAQIHDPGHAEDCTRSDDITPAWQNGYTYAQRLHTQHGYDPAQIRDAANVYERGTYGLPAERADYDDGVSAYLYLTFTRRRTP